MIKTNLKYSLLLVFAFLLAMGSLKATYVCAFSQPTQITVQMFRLDPATGAKYQPEELCSNGNTHWGCTAIIDEPQHSYPFSSNPVTVDIEGNDAGDPQHGVDYNRYLRDVVPEEVAITVSSRGNKPLSTVKAQAIAARTYVYFRHGLTINNSAQYQVFVPYYYDTLTSAQQQRVDEAVSDVWYMTLPNSTDPIDALYGADNGATTSQGYTSYLKSVSDPISADYGSPIGTLNGGMSSRGASRWGFGHISSRGPDYETSPKYPHDSNDEGDFWGVRWKHAEQILVHYYTGVHIRDDSGTPVTPNDRWNLLWHDNFGFPAGETPTLNNAQTYPLRLQLQNTSVSDWAENEVTLGYQWTVRGANTDPANWSPLSTLPALREGEYTPTKDDGPLTVRVPAPCGTGEYTLHLDVKRNGAWFSKSGWYDAKIDVTVQLGTPQVTAGRGYYTDGLGVLYYNDEDDGQWEIGGEITWQTFTPPIIFSTVKPYINFDTDTSSPAPGVNGTFWSAIWEGNLYVPQTGRYRFYLGGLDDGGRLYLDANPTPIIDKWLVQGPHEYFSPLVTLREGLHAFRVEYAQGPGLEAGLSVCWEGPSFAKEVIAPSGAISGIPTPTPFLTPTPVPTATSTPLPTSPPPRWAPAEQVLMQDEPAKKREAFSDLLSRIRDQVLLSDPKGKVYVQIIYRFAPEITRLLAKDEHLRVQVKALALEMEPLLEAMLANRPPEESPRLSAAQVEHALRVLDAVERQASPDLKQEIQWWKERLPEFEGKTGIEIWEMLPARSK